LVTRTVAGEQSLLPIWYDLTIDKVMASSPSLADEVAMNTSDYSIEDIASPRRSPRSLTTLFEQRDTSCASTQNGSSRFAA
jgi:hypothetical protein